MKVVYRKGKHNPCHCDACLYSFYWQPCKGCRDGHPSFWKTVIESPQWKEWQKEQMNPDSKYQKRDMPEVEETNVISPEHFQEFLRFCKKNKLI